ncbi:MAG: hypothetical protein ACE5JG_11005, partial [Planctomycetota bacterium]
MELYEADHPRGRQHLDRAYASLRSLLDERREVVLTQAEGRLYLDQAILDSDRELARQLADDLAARGVRSLVFHATLTPEEQLGLIRCLLARPDRTAARGGFGQLLSDQGVASVKATGGRTSAGPAPGREPSAGERNLIDLVIQLGRGRPGPGAAVEEPGAEALPSVSSVLAQDSAALAQAIAAVARRRESGSAPRHQAVAEVTADTLERLAEMALEERRRDREEILADVGRVLVASDPAIHPILFLEKGGPRSIRKNLVAAVEGLSTEAVGELVVLHHPRSGGDYRQLSDILNRTLAWRSGRDAAVAAVRRRLEPLGLGPEARRDLIDHLQGNALGLARRVELLCAGEDLWRVDFTRLREVLVKLLAADQVRQASDLIQKYLGGLLSARPDVRRRVADRARYILQMIEKTGKGQPMLGRITELFFTRLQEEEDEEVAGR